MGLAEKPWFRKFLVGMSAKPLLKKFDRQAEDLTGTQDALLKSMIEYSRDTAFGRDHNFDSIATYEDFVRNIPIGDFESHRPYIERMMKGEQDVLFPGKPVIYNTSSGTTSKPKMIPISKEYFDTNQVKCNKVWLYSCVLENPRIYDGKSISAVSAAVEGHVEDGTPYGSISGLSYQNIPEVLKSTFSTPYAVITIKDYQKKYYAMMRFALAENITIIISPSPSNIMRFQQTIMENFGDLVNDIRNGTLRQDVMDAVPEEGLDEVRGALKPKPERADELERLLREHGDQLRPKHYWPNLALANIWVQGNFALLVPKLDGYFPPSCKIRAFGYQASEGRAGLVLKNDWDYSALAIGWYFFEFIEEGKRDDPDPPVLRAHELEVGKRYFIFFTNGSGLFRYDINDIVEIVGYYKQVPLFRFIQKGEGVTSITGEKLTEVQVIDAVKAVSVETGTKIENYLMYADKKAFHYHFFAEFAADMSTSDKEGYVQALDDKLREYNPEYEAKRGSGRLEPPVLHTLPAGSHDLMKSKLVERGAAREGQYKNVYLSKKEMIQEVLEELSRSA